MKKNKINEIWDSEETDLNKFKKQTRKTIFKVIGIGSCILILGLGLLITRVFKWFDSSCANKIISEKPQPDGSYKAVLFIRDCGATTRQSNQISIVKSGSDIDNSDSGNVFITYDPVSVTWSQNKILAIDYAGGQVFKQKERFKGIRIVYDK